MQSLKFFLLIWYMAVIGNNAYAMDRKHPSLKEVSAEKEKRNSPTNQLLKSYLEFSSFRHKILSQNIANINTPGYAAEDVALPKKYEDLATRSGAIMHDIAVTKTNNKHIGSVRKGNKRGKFFAHKIKDPYEVKPNGNNVSLPQQMTKLSQNQHDYNMAVKNYSTTNSLISAVLGR